MSRTLGLLCILAVFAPAGCGPGTTLDAVTFNEFEPRNDFFELYNDANGSIDLSGFQVADDTPDHGPRLERALTFPEGTSIPGKGFLLVVANLGDEALPGLRTECREGGAETCFHASFGISRDIGEVFYLLDPEGEVVIRHVYPPKAVNEGFSYGRVPDGSGGFGTTRPTPGLPNQAPWKKKPRPAPPTYGAEPEPATDAGAAATTGGAEAVTGGAEAVTGDIAAPPKPKPAPKPFKPLPPLSPQFESPDLTGKTPVSDLPDLTGNTPVADGASESAEDGTDEGAPSVPDFTGNTPE